MRVRWWALRPARDLGEIVVGPTVRPTISPTISPTIVPTIQPTIRPTIQPTIQPTLVPPTLGPTVGPTVLPTIAPTFAPTVAPTVRPTISPTLRPTIGPGDVVVRPVTDVNGIGRVSRERLAGAGINDLSALARADVATVAEALGTSEVRARDFIESARELDGR